MICFDHDVHRFGPVPSRGRQRLPERGGGPSAAAPGERGWWRGPASAINPMVKPRTLVERGPSTVAFGAGPLPAPGRRSSTPMASLNFMNFTSERGSQFRPMANVTFVTFTHLAHRPAATVNCVNFAPLARSRARAMATGNFSELYIGAGSAVRRMARLNSMNFNHRQGECGSSEGTCNWCNPSPESAWRNGPRSRGACRRRSAAGPAATGRRRRRPRW